jgi:FAD/FMN-containing dehydrogenase
MSDFISQLQKIVGDKFVLTGEAAEPFLEDTRKLVKGKALAVVRPADTQQVSEVVKLCAAHKVAIVPQGGNTSYMGGAVPHQGNEIILSLGRMDKVREINARDFTMTVDAGCILRNLQEAAAEKNCLLPLKLASEGTCQIGGNIATNAGGILTIRYGNTRDLVLGLEVVLANGEIWNGLRHLRKDNTGYDLKQLFIGSEGSLGIITGAVLKLFPLPTHKETFFVALKDLSLSLELYTQARTALGDCLNAYELVPHSGIKMAKEYNVPCVDPLTVDAKWLILGEVSAAVGTDSLRARVEGFLEQAFEKGLIVDGTIAESEAQRADLWRMREAIVAVQAYGGVVLKCDVSVPIAQMPAFIDEADALVTKMMPGILPHGFGHLGDGNIHLNYIQPKGMKAEEFRARMHDIEQAVHNMLIDKYNGSFSAEHGIGQFKRDELAVRKSKVEMDMMLAVKRVLDPDNLMNPGSVV